MSKAEQRAELENAENEAWKAFHVSDEAYDEAYEAWEEAYMALRQFDKDN